MCRHFSRESPPLAQGRATGCRWQQSESIALSRYKIKRAPVFISIVKILTILKTVFSANQNMLYFYHRRSRMVNMSCQQKIGRGWFQYILGKEVGRFKKICGPPYPKYSLFLGRRLTIYKSEDPSPNLLPQNRPHRNKSEDPLHPKTIFNPQPEKPVASCTTF